MAHTHEVYDDDLCFVIDTSSRVVTHQSEEPIVISDKDHNSESFTFEMPRYVDGHDMLLCNKVEVHYINTSSDKSSKKSIGVYPVTDLAVDSEDENTVLFTWLVSQNATMYVGSLTFSIRFMCVTGTKIDYSWATKAFSDITIIDSVDNTDVVVEQHADTLQEWYMELLMAGVSGVNMVDAAAEEAIARISSIDYVVKVEDDALQRILFASLEAESNIRQSMVDAEEQKEEIINNVINRLPKYSGEIDDIISHLKLYKGEMEEVI